MGGAAKAAVIAEQIDHYMVLGQRVVDQSRRRVLEGESVPNDEKLFSIFEPHTELIKRGRRNKPVEFGHAVLLCQTGEKFITDYEVFEERKADCELTEMVGTDMSTVSRHLMQLKQAGLIEDEKRGQMVFYRLRAKCAVDFFDCIESVIKCNAKSQQELLA